MPRVECPKCAATFDVPPTQLHQIVECPKCTAAFPAIASDERERSSEPFAEYAAAQQAIRYPAKLFANTIIACMVANAFSGVGIFIFGFSKIRIFAGNSNSSDYLEFGVATLILGTLYLIPILIGAAKLKRLESYTWPMVSAILAIAAALFFWTIPILNLVLAGVGFSVLLRINRPEIRAAIRWKQRRGGDWRNIPKRRNREEEPINEPDDEDDETEPFSGRENYFTESYNPENSNDREIVIAEARRRVAAPSKGLLVTGIIGVALSVLSGIGQFVSVLLSRQFRAAELAVSVGISIAFAFKYFLIAKGGMDLGNLKNRGLAITAAVLGMMGIMMCGMWSVISVPGMIFGAWAFAALSSREVKHAMRWKRQEREDRHTE